MDVEYEPDLILSIYPDPSVVDRKLNYSTQIVRSKSYYSEDIQNLINLIDLSSSPIEVEKAIDDFNNYIETQKQGFLRNQELYLKRENINQRTIYVLTDEKNKLKRACSDTKEEPCHLHFQEAQNC